ncbi:MAG: hypothetical protein R2857_06225 [Vampirovibrionales bacterium]
MAKLGNLLKNPGFRRDVMRGKSRIMLIDLGLFAIAGQLTFWGKNWMTERLAHRKGFSGIFKYTSADSHQAGRRALRATKKDRIAASIVWEFWEHWGCRCWLTGWCKARPKQGWLNR